tara:strand:+ start:1116 stop:1358 length:243 start_codon:yes stop_codon:yes gene_type:complete
MIYLKDSVDSSFYYTVIVSKKTIPLAVNRNKIKRRIREAVIKIYSETNLKYSSNVIIYKSKNILSFKEIIKDLSFLFEKL